MPGMRRSTTTASTRAASVSASGAATRGSAREAGLRVGVRPPQRPVPAGAGPAGSSRRPASPVSGGGVARPILPPMPWQGMAVLPERDLKAIYAYLMAQPAVKNKVPEYVPPMAGEMR